MDARDERRADILQSPPGASVRPLTLSTLCQLTPTLGNGYLVKSIRVSPTSCSIWIPGNSKVYCLHRPSVSHVRDGTMNAESKLFCLLHHVLSVFHPRHQTDTREGNPWHPKDTCILSTSSSMHRPG